MHVNLMYVLGPKIYYLVFSKSIRTNLSTWSR